MLTYFLVLERTPHGRSDISEYTYIRKGYREKEVVFPVFKNTSGVNQVMKDPESWLTMDELNSILKAASNYRDKMYMMGLYETGRRNGEFLMMQPSHIREEDNQILFHISKKQNNPDLKKWKDVNPRYINLITKYIDDKAIRPDQRIFNFCKRRGRQIVKEAAIRSGISKYKNCHPHMFRHSFAIHFVKGPLAKSNNAIRDLILLQDYLEHSNITMTLWYLQYGDKAMRKAILKLPGIEERKGAA